MLGRRKSDDGFEWHKYVRTAVKLRREERRRRILEARRAAVQQAGAAGVALAAGSKAAGAAALDGARVGVGVAGLMAQAAWNLLVTLAAIAWHYLAAASVATLRQLAILLRPLMDALARPKIGGPVAIMGAMALALGIGRSSGAGLDREASIALAIGVVLVFAALPLLSQLSGIRLPHPSALGISRGTALIGVGVVGVIGVLAWVGSNGARQLAGIASQLPMVGGIEAPELQQSCGAAARRTRCGAAAQAALSKLVNGRTLACAVSGADGAGRPLATCTRGGLDINGELVRQGHAFAARGLFAGYAGLERQARDAKLGIWAAGDVERPAEFRAKIWDEAKRHAPDGCPIKGLVTGEGRVYVLPWSPDYDRGRIQKTRGERWFCSEREAEAAGFKPAVRG